MKKILAIIISFGFILSANTFMSFAASPTVTLSVAEDSVYKNLYTVSADGSAVEDTHAVSASLESLSGYIDSAQTAYIAFAVYAPKTGDYNFKLSFTGGDYAAVKVGNTVKTVDSSLGEFTLTLSEGVNLITCFGATAELEGAAITYKDLICEDSLYEIAGNFYFMADVNSDTVVDIRDLVRLKKYMANVSEINVLAADLSGDSYVTTADMIILRKCLLGDTAAKEAVVLQYDLIAVNRDNEVPDNWDF